MLIGVRVRDIMTRDVTTVGPEATLREAAALMRGSGVGALPVCAGDAVVGILTDRDIAVRSTAEGQDPGSVLVRDVMSTGIATVAEDQDVEEAAWMMEIRRVRRLVVVDGERALRGLVSLADLSLRSPGEGLCAEVLRHVTERGAGAVRGD